jgi:type II secretory pathway pseudopilin PulG
LIELFVVIGIIGLLMVLIVPAFTSLRSGTDVTSAAYTIKGVLDGVQLFFRELRSAVSVERGDK